jgi:hypothetical protein
VEFFGSLPCLRPVQRVDKRGLRAAVDTHRIPRKILG